MNDEKISKTFSITKSNGYKKQENDDEVSIGSNSQDSIIEQPHQTNKPTLNWIDKLAYASVGLPYSMQLSIIAFYINFFLLDVAKVSPNYNAIILFVSRLIDAITDPIGGYLFTRITFRWGKMKPWILFSAPFISLFYFGVWCLPIIPESGQLVYYLFAHSLLWTFMTASRIPHTALTVYITVNQNERDQLTRYRTLLEAAGLLLSIIFHWLVMSAFKVPMKSNENCVNITENAIDGLTANIEANSISEPIARSLEVASNVAGAYMTSAGIISLICIASSVFLFFRIREVVDVIQTNETSFSKGLKMILVYRPFIILTIATVASLLATQSIQSVLELYLTHVRQESNHFIYLASTLIIATMILLVVWSIVMTKIGKKRSFLIGNLCLIPAIIVILLKDYPIALLYVAAIIGANTVACGYVMPWAMLPECIDAFMLQTGRRPVESFYTFFFLGAKVVQALYSGLVQISLGASGFDSSLCGQSENVKLTLRLLMGAVPGIVLVFSTICLFFYPIDDNRAKEIQFELKKLRKIPSESKANFEDGGTETGLNETRF